MGFMDNIFKSTLIEPFPKEPPTRIMLIGDFAGYFEHVKTIISYSPEEIILGVKKNIVKVVGEKLLIKRFCEGDVVICGKIISVSKG